MVLRNTKQPLKNFWLLIQLSGFVWAGKQKFHNFLSDLHNNLDELLNIYAFISTHCELRCDFCHEPTAVAHAVSFLWSIFREMRFSFDFLQALNRVILSLKKKWISSFTLNLLTGSQLAINSVLKKEKSIFGLEYICNNCSSGCEVSSFLVRNQVFSKKMIMTILLFITLSRKFLLFPINKVSMEISSNE